MRYNGHERVRTAVAKTCEDYGRAHVKFEHARVFSAVSPVPLYELPQRRQIRMLPVYAPWKQQRTIRDGHESAAFACVARCFHSVAKALVCRDVVPALCYKLALKARARERAWTYRFRKNERSTTAGQ